MIVCLLGPWAKEDFPWCAAATARHLLGGFGRLTGNPEANFSIADNWSISPPHSIQGINALL